MRAQAINRELKYLDKELYAVKADTGLVHIFRKGVRWESFDFGNDRLSFSRPSPHHILTLTHNWSASGRPVEWGIEPLLARLKEIDNHNHDVLARIWEENEKKESLRKRAKSNDLKAMAYDVRRDFAKSVNEVNTSTLAKTELRRKKDYADRSKRP